MSNIHPDLATAIIAGAIDTVVNKELVETTGDRNLDMAIARLADDVNKLDDVLPEKPVQAMRVFRDHGEADEQPLLKFGQGDYETRIYEDDIK